MTRIDKKFAELRAANKKAFVTYVMAGDPNYDASLEVVKGLPNSGVDIIELGLPFTDPMADGPTIQLAGQRSLEAGMTLNKTLQMVRDFRNGDNTTPIVLMGYYNPIYSRGVDRFLADAKDAGMIWSFMHYELAENCTSCHGLSRDDVEPEILAKLVTNGHPANENFEYIAYSQGSVRHRFYPPDVTVNAEMDTIQLSRTYVIGQAAILVSASNGLARATDDKYKLFQQNRFDAAKLALSAITDIPEIKKLLDEPTSENGKKLAEAIKDVDLSKSVAKMLPEKSKYK